MTDKNEAAAALLKALVRAFQDPRRPEIMAEGIEERDLAFEADLLLPLEMEIPIYASQKRSSIVRLLEQMQKQGFIEFKNPRPGTLYRILPTPNGEKIGRELLTPWHSKLTGWFTRKKQ